MWRSLFLAVGLTLMIIGAECLVVDRAVFAQSIPGPGGQGESQGTSERTVAPPDWAPWSLLSAGAVVCIYSFTIPRRVKG